MPLAGCGASDLPVGAPCYVGECELGAVCARVNDEGDGADACIALCDDDFQCPLGGTCYPTGTGSVWGCFPGGDTQLGDACTDPVECREGLICEFATADPPTGFCSPWCAPASCGEGRPCVWPTDCTLPLLCALAHDTAVGASGECAQPCPAVSGSSISLCPTGELCAPVSEGALDWGCYPGGAVRAGEPCELLGECERGYVCWSRSGSLRCVKVCSTAADCAPGEPCTDGVCGA